LGRGEGGRRAALGWRRPPLSSFSLSRRGDACPHAHGVFETWLHPSRYRTQPCRAGAACDRAICFFAHGPPRAPPAGDRPVLPPRKGGAPAGAVGLATTSGRAPSPTAPPLPASSSDDDGGGSGAGPSPPSSSGGAAPSPPARRGAARGRRGSRGGGGERDARRDGSAALAGALAALERARAAEAAAATAAAAAATARTVDPRVAAMLARLDLGPPAARAPWPLRGAAFCAPPPPTAPFPGFDTSWVDSLTGARGGGAGAF